MIDIGSQRSKIPVFVRVRRVRVVDVEVFVVLSEDGQPPGPVLVVSDRHPGQHWLPAANDVPSGRHQMHPIAQRRSALGPMGVVGHHRKPGDGPTARHHPVVAADGVVVLLFQINLTGHGRGQPLERLGVATIGRRHIVWLEPKAAPVGPVEIEDVVVQQGRVDGGVNRQVRVAVVVVQFLDRVGAQERDGPGIVYFGGDIPHQPLMSRNHHLRGPMLRRDVQQSELQRQQGWIRGRLVDVGVDASGQTPE